MKLFDYWIDMPLASFPMVVYFALDRQVRRKAAMAIWLIVSVVAAVVGFRYLPAYFGQLIAITALLATASLGFSIGLLAPAKAAQRIATAVILLALVLRVGKGSNPTNVAHVFRSLPVLVGRPAPTEERLRQNGNAIAMVVSKHTQPNDRVFIWGYRPYVYWRARRMPAVHDFLIEQVTGWTAGGAGTSKTSPIPGAQETMLHDLEAHPPAIIVDTSINPVDSWGDRFSMDRYPLLSRWVNAHYVEAGHVLGHRVLMPRRSG